MTQQRYPPDDPREWLNRARSNLSRARTVGEGTYFEDPCFDAQQAAEKAIKGVLIHHGIAFSYTHDLGRLLTLLEETGAVLPDEVLAADELTRFAVVTRYPGFAEQVTAEQHARAMEVAETVVRWAEEQITGAAGPGGSAAPA